MYGWPGWLGLEKTRQQPSLYAAHSSSNNNIVSWKYICVIQTHVRKQNKQVRLIAEPDSQHPLSLQAMSYTRTLMCKYLPTATRRKVFNNDAIIGSCWRAVSTTWYHQRAFSTSGLSISLHCTQRNKISRKHKHVTLSLQQAIVVVQPHTSTKNYQLIYLFTEWMRFNGTFSTPAISCLQKVCCS